MEALDARGGNLRGLLRPNLARGRKQRHFLGQRLGRRRLQQVVQHCVGVHVTVADAREEAVNVPVVEVLRDPHEP